MALSRYLRARNWPVAAGYLLFGGMMAVGYVYNVTFVQLGLKDLGERVLGLPAAAVAGQMALLALLTTVTALFVGFWQQRCRPATLLGKLQLVLAVVLIQTALTAVAPQIRSQSGFSAWIVAGSLVLGVGVPATFSLTTDLIPVQDRGYVAAAITAAAYFIAAMFAGAWRIDALSRLLLLMMLPGALALTVVVLLATADRSFVARYVQEVSENHQLARFAAGRFLQQHELASRRLSRRFLELVALMFGIFFIDSLGFLRIIDTPILARGAWRALLPLPHLVIAASHILGAFIAGVLYTYLDQRHLFYWVFSIFALTHFSYGLSVWLLPETTTLALGTPVLYATAVSFYTVLNFALWADYSTPQTIGRNTAIGVAFSGWMATFSSTALAIGWQSRGMPLLQHLRLVQALALLFLLLMLLRAAWPYRPAASEER